MARLFGGYVAVAIVVAVAVAVAVAAVGLGVNDKLLVGGQWHDDASFYPCTLALLVRSSPFHILLVAAAAAAAFAAPATLLHFLRNL